VGSIVVVTGAAGPLGRRVVDDVAGAPGVARVVAVGPSLVASTTPASPKRAEVRVAPFLLDDPRLAEALVGATDVVHLGSSVGPELDGTGGGAVDLMAVAGMLAMLDEVGAVEHLVVLSSALVYGDHEDNPVPITEDTPARPDPAVPQAVAKLSVERLARGWADDRGLPCAVLRPSIVVAPENGRWLGRSHWSSAGVQVAGAEPPVQFLHVDDLVTAIAAVRRTRLDATVNAAPDGWLTAEELRALKGPAARVRLPRQLALWVAHLGAAVGFGQGDPTAVLASAAPWVLANDRLRSTGWAPAHTSEEAFVMVDPGGPWSRLTPKDRQALALGGVGLVGAVVLAAVLVVVQRLRRVRRR
jgi:nucleoside-diphosphate-sugar epimerase